MHKRAYKQKYRQYLKSPQWKDKKLVVLKRDSFKCTICGTAKDLEVHHDNYDTVFDENIDDLRTLCSYHHKKEHGILPLWERIVLLLHTIGLYFLLFSITILIYFLSWDTIIKKDIENEWITTKGFPKAKQPDKK